MNERLKLFSEKKIKVTLWMRCITYNPRDILVNESWLWRIKLDKHAGTDTLTEIYFNTGKSGKFMSRKKLPTSFYSYISL